MNFLYKKVLFFTFCALSVFVSCDDEQIDNNLLNDVETLLPDSELANMIQEIASVDVFECAAFQYPISFGLYNTNFQNIETVTIQNDSELLSFFESLNSTTSNVALLSLNFPATLMYDNGTSITVQNNQELEAALLAASDNCGDEQACDMEAVRNYLISCSQIPTLNEYTPSLTEFEFYDSNELFTMFEQDLPHNGTWDITMIEGEVVVFITFNGLEDYNGQWIVTSCTETSLMMMQDDNTLTLNQGCDTNNPFECFGTVESEIVVCDELNDGVEVYDLTQVFANCNQATGITMTYHMSETNAQAGINAIPNPNAYANTSNPNTVFVRVELMTDGTFEIFPITLILENCNCDNPNFMTDDLVIYMPFANEAINLVDNSSAENLPVDFVADRDGNTTCAVAFNGDNYLTIPVTDANQLVQGDAFTVSIWFKMQNTEIGDYEGIFQKGEATNEGFQLGVYDLNTPLFGDSTYGYGLWDTYWNQELDVEWENTDWHHLAVTVDANNTVRLYRDGTLRNMDENSSINIDTTPLENYFIGLGFQGHLDDLRVYKRALSDNDIGDLYNSGTECFTCF